MSLTQRLRDPANFVNLAVADSLGREAAERIAADEALLRQALYMLEDSTVGGRDLLFELVGKQEGAYWAKVRSGMEAQLDKNYDVIVALRERLK